MATKPVRDGDIWKMAAQRLARAILRFEKDDFARVYTESTMRFVYRVLKGNV